MPRQFNPPYTVGFVAVVSVVCALLLSSAATILKPMQEANQQFDVRRNIIRAFGQDLGAHPTPVAVNAFFDQRIRGKVVDSNGQDKAGQSAEKINPEEEDKKPAAERQYPLFVLLDEAGAKPMAYAVPVIGKGLWSTIYGYLAMGDDLNTVLGVTFYKHGETPGLGAEVAEKWFQDNFKGKKLLDNTGKFVSIKVLKGKVVEQFPDGNDHAVDGISGATMTCAGVNKFLHEDLGKYLVIIPKMAQ